MKVQQFVQGSKVAQSQSGAPSRAMPKAGAAAEAKPSDFANALEDARKKPDPKPAGAEAPAVKKPTATATKKAKSTKNQPQPANDEQPESEEVTSADESSAAVAASTPAQDEALDGPAGA